MKKLLISTFVMAAIVIASTTTNVNAQTKADAPAIKKEAKASTITKVPTTEKAVSKNLKSTPSNAKTVPAKKVEKLEKSMKVETLVLDRAKGKDGKTACAGTPNCKCELKDGHNGGHDCAPKDGKIKSLKAKSSVIKKDNIGTCVGTPGCDCMFKSGHTGPHECAPQKSDKEIKKK